MADKLNNSEIEYVRFNLVSDKQATVVRFLKDGRNLNIETGYLLPKGINVINQIHYWNFPKWLSLEIAKWLDARAIFSSDEQVEDDEDDIEYREYWTDEREDRSS